MLIKICKWFTGDKWFTLKVVLFVMLMTKIAYAANQKLSALTSATGLSLTDIIYIVINPGSSPASRSTTLTEVMRVIPVDSNELENTSGSLGLANHATARAALGLTIGTNVLAPDGDGGSLTNLNGENLQNDTIDDDSIDFTDVTLNDFTFDVGNVDKTEFGYLNGVTGNLQTQLNTLAGYTASSAGLAGALSDETGSGAAVFGTSPSLTTPDIGAATGQSVSPDSTVNGDTFVFRVYDDNGTTWRAITVENGDSSDASYSNWPRLNFPSGVVVTGLALPIVTLDPTELNDTSTPHSLIATELMNITLTNAGVSADAEWDAPALQEGYMFTVVCEEANYDMTIDPNGTENWYLNGSANGAGTSITNDCSTIGEPMVCFSTGTRVYCKSDSANWVQGS